MTWTGNTVPIRAGIESYRSWCRVRGYIQKVPRRVLPVAIIEHVYMYLLAPMPAEGLLCPNLPRDLVLQRGRGHLRVSQALFHAQDMNHSTG